MKKSVLICLILFFGIIGFVSASNVGLIENETWQSGLTALQNSNTVFGDIDGDGDGDLIVTGCISSCTSSFSKVYINNGSSLVENSTWQNNLTGVSWGSTALGDIDNDGDLDMVLTGCLSSGSTLTCDGTKVSKIYLNNGTSFVESSQWQNNLIAISDSSISLGDIDNDGDLDLITIGNTVHARTYLNNGTSFVESSQWQNDLTGVYQGQVALGDIDNDGDLDLALTGDSGTDFTSFYLNNGTSFVESSQWNTNLVNMDRSSLLFGNYNNDEYLDLMICGHTSGDHCYLYKNTGSTLELNQTRDDALLGIYRASISYGDYDNDGDLDFVGMGLEIGRAKVLENNETNNYYFQEDSLAHANISDNILRAALAWNDLDGDLDLDLIAIGNDYNDGFVAKIFINNNTVSNTQPSAPVTFTSNFTDGILNLSWGNGSDSETPNLGLYYNIMVGNSTNNHTIVSGIYGGSSGGGGGSGGGASGYFGNMMQRKHISLNVALADGTYNWYVQTIDTGLAKSNWSTIQSFTVTDDSTAPNLTSISSSVTSTTATVTWTSDETANSTVYYGTSISLGSDSGSSSLVTSHSVSLSGLTASTLYYYNVSSCDYWSNCNTSIQYNFTTSAAAVVDSPGGGGNSNYNSGGSTISRVVNESEDVELGEFNIDFSNVSNGSLEVGQGGVKTFSFNGETTHKITVSEVGVSAVKLIIESEPIVIVLTMGEIKQIDINQDGIDDFEIKLFSIANGKANLYLRKLDGADIAGREELDEVIKKEALFDVKIDIVNLFEVVKSGRQVIAEIEVLNVNNIGQVDVLVEYYLTSKEDNESRLVEGSDSLAVEAVASFVRNLRVPYDVKSGEYSFNVNIIYKDAILASSSAEFRVVKTYEIGIGIGVFLLVVFGIVFYLWWIGQREKKLEKVVKRLEKGKK